MLKYSVGFSIFSTAAGLTLVLNQGTPGNLYGCWILLEGGQKQRIKCAVSIMDIKENATLENIFLIIIHIHCG